MLLRRVGALDDPSSTDDDQLVDPDVCLARIGAVVDAVPQQAIDRIVRKRFPGRPHAVLRSIL